MNWKRLLCRLIGHRWQLVPRTDVRAAKLLQHQLLKECKRCGETDVEYLTFHGGSGAA